MDLWVACPLSTRSVTSLIMWYYMGRRLLTFCVVGIGKQKVHCYWFFYSNFLAVIVKCIFINGENHLNRVILGIKFTIFPMFSTRRGNKERYSKGLWLVDRLLLWWNEPLISKRKCCQARMNVYFCTLSKHTKLYLKSCETLYMISAVKE